MCPHWMSAVVPSSRMQLRSCAVIAALVSIRAQYSLIPSTRQSQPSLLLQLERGGVHAEALARGLGRSVIEDMAEMRAAAAAHDLDAPHTQRPILRSLHLVGSNGRPKARPSAARLVLRFRGEQLLAAGCAEVHPLLFRVVVLAGPGRLSALLAHDLVLLGGQFLPPLLIAFHDLFWHIDLADKVIMGS